MPTKPPIVNCECNGQTFEVNSNAMRLIAQAQVAARTAVTNARVILSRSDEFPETDPREGNEGWLENKDGLVRLEELERALEDVVALGPQIWRHQNGWRYAEGAQEDHDDMVAFLEKIARRTLALQQRLTAKGEL